LHRLIAALCSARGAKLIFPQPYGSSLDITVPSATYPLDMAMVTVLAVREINRRKVHQRLTRAGYATVAAGGSVRISRHGRWDAVDTYVADATDLPPDARDSAKQLLGLAPSNGITCSFEGEAGRSDAWTTVVDIARAVAAEVPLAVLDDPSGTTYLVHPGRGLIGPEAYAGAQRDTTSDLLRRMFGDR
jgi:hypothetical protein